MSSMTSLLRWSCLLCARAFKAASRRHSAVSISSSLQKTHTSFKHALFSSPVWWRKNVPWSLLHSGILLLLLQYLFPKVKSKDYIATGREITCQWCMTECTQSLYKNGRWLWYISLWVKKLAHLEVLCTSFFKSHFTTRDTVPAKWRSNT